MPDELDILFSWEYPDQPPFHLVQRIERGAEIVLPTLTQRDFKTLTISCVGPQQIPCQVAAE
jgi:hypothetical protein